MDKLYHAKIEIHPRIYKHFTDQAYQSFDKSKGSIERAEKHALWWIVKNLTTIPLLSITMDQVHFEREQVFSTNHVFFMDVPYPVHGFRKEEDGTPLTTFPIDTIPIKYVSLEHCDFHPVNNQISSITLQVPRNMKPSDRTRDFTPIP